MKRAIVVGTGAGGATIARALAEAFDVTILEAGSEFRRFAGDLGVTERLRASRLMFDPRMIRLLFPEMHVAMASDRMALVCGIATGGTTTLATGNALRCDQELLRRDVDLSEEFDALGEELPISTAHAARWRPVTKELFACCQQLGLQPTLTPKLVDYARCTRCGRCVLGCPTGAKWDSRRLLEDAVARGARLETDSPVESVLLEGNGPSAGRATGVVYRSGGRRRLQTADLVVLAAGGFGTARILSRSGVATQDHLFVDPVLCVAAHVPGSFADEEVPMAFFVEGDGYMISPYFDYLSFFFNREWRRPRHDIVSLMIKLADSEAGTVDRRGVKKMLSTRDRQRLLRGTDACIEILGRCGVRRDRVFLGSLNAGHPGGTLPITGREHHPFHADHLPDNLYVADSSLLPNSLGKPPILTIMAMAQRIGKLCVERFT